MATNNVGSDGRTHDLMSPAFRNAFGNQSIILDAGEVFYLKTDGVFTDNITRTFLVTVSDGTATATVELTQAYIVHIFKDDVLVNKLSAGTATLLTAGTDETTVTGTTIRIGFDAPNYFIIPSTLMGADNVINITRLDGMVQDLITDTA